MVSTLTHGPGNPGFDTQLSRFFHNLQLGLTCGIALLWQCSIVITIPLELTIGKPVLENISCDLNSGIEFAGSTLAYSISAAELERQ